MKKSHGNSHQLSDHHRIQRSIYVRGTDDDRSIVRPWQDKTVQCDQYYGDLYAYSVSNGFKSYLIRSGWNLVGIDADLRSERNHLLSDLPLSDA